MGREQNAEQRPAGLPVGPKLIAILRLAYRAGLPVILEGPTGIGKSEIVRQTALELGIEHKVLNLSLLEPPDLVGLPVINAGRTTYAVPSALPISGAGILLLEELNRAERYIQQPALQLLTARQLHEYELPKGWVVFAAINPETGDYQVTPLDRAMRARFMNLLVRADRASWILWAEKNGVHPVVISLAKQHDHILDTIPPRTWTYVSQAIKTATSEELQNRDLLGGVLQGYLPMAWVHIVLDALENWNQTGEIDAYQLLAQYDSSPEWQQRIRELVQQGQTDKLHQIADRVGEVIRDLALNQVSADGPFRMEAFDRLLQDLPGDRREQLQAEIASNPSAVRLVIDAKDLDVILRDYSKAETGNSQATQLHKKLSEWATHRHTQHRVALVALGLAGYLANNKQDLPKIRSSRSCSANIRKFLADLEDKLNNGSSWGASLRDRVLSLMQEIKKHVD